MKPFPSPGRRMITEVAINKRLGRIADRQYGLIAARQLRSLGLSDEQRRHLLVSGLLIPVRRGVYRLMGVPPCWEQAVLAAVLAAGPAALASHATAAGVWGLRHCDRNAGLHVTAPRQLRLRGVTGHVAIPDPAQRRGHLGIPLTSPEQTIVDLAASLPARDLAECVDDALRRGLIRLGRLRRLAAMAGGAGRPAVTSLRQVLADRSPDYDGGGSDWEREMDRRWEKWGLPPAVRQYRTRANGRTYIIDRAIPELMIGIEWNGFETHGTRSGFDRDSDKRADLTAAGWHMVDFTSRSTQDRICRAVRSAVARRQAVSQVS